MNGPPLETGQPSLIRRFFHGDLDALGRLIIYLAELTVFGAFSLALLIALQSLVPIASLSPVELVLLQGVINIALVCFSIFLVKVFHRSSFWQWIHWFRNHNFRTASLIVLGALLAVTGLFAASFFPPNEPPPIEKLLSSSTSALFVFAIFGIVVAPLFEEIIFRGFLFKMLFEMAGSRAAILLTAALFAVPHIPQLWGSWAGILLIFVMGCILAFVRNRSNSLIPAIIIHTAYNATLFGLFAVSTLVQKAAG